MNVHTKDKLYVLALGVLVIITAILEGHCPLY